MQIEKKKKREEELRKIICRISWKKRCRSNSSAIQKTARAISLPSPQIRIDKFMWVFFSLPPTKASLSRDSSLCASSLSRKTSVLDSLQHLWMTNDLRLYWNEAAWCLHIPRFCLRISLSLSLFHILQEEKKDFSPLKNAELQFFFFIYLFISRKISRLVF